MNCLICDQTKTKLAIKDYPGYIQDTFFDIFYCPSCNTSFMDISNYDDEIYEKIYNITKNNPDYIKGYGRYAVYAEEIKFQPNPLLYLIQKEDSYFPIYSYLKDKPKLKILEIGCGLGYMTYALKMQGHEVIGCDISEEAINFAKETFGDNYKICDILENSSFEPQSFDLIFGTELIEHIPNVRDFIQNCSTLLIDGGSILFTTPNKDFIPNSTNSWFTENPPIHTVWFSKRSFQSISNNLGLKLSFINPYNKYARYNLLVPNLFSCLNSLLSNSFLKPGHVLNNKSHNSAIKNFISTVMNFPIIYNTSNFINRIIFKEHCTLFVRLEK
jgi:2-polyprenyl-3-methyl-5-hydroxy-6-metoxy-1,4-benzoquinol methylase